MKKKTGVFVYGQEIVLEKRKLPKPGETKVGSVWDGLFKVFKKGDSFLMPYKPHSINSLYTTGRKKGWKIATRREIHQGVKKLRVYRVK